MKNLRHRIRKVMIVSPPLLKERTEFYPDFPTPPLGVGYVSANAGPGIITDILDLSFYTHWEEICHIVDSTDEYDMYAFSSMTPTFPNALAIARYLRTKRDSLYVLGGSHATVFPHKTLALGVFDIVVTGEAEATFRELLVALNTGRKLSSVRGIAYRTSKGQLILTPRRDYIQDLDSLAFPDRASFPMGQYLTVFGNIIKGERGTTMLCSRGCPYSCTFCSKEIFGREPRWRSAHNIVTEILDLVKTYDIDTVHFVDDTFTLKPTFVRGVCESLAKSGYPVEWQCESRVDTVDFRTLKMMRMAGCKRIMFGVESGNDRMLKRMGKGSTRRQALRVFDFARQVGINTGAFIVLGHPGETLESLADTIDIVRRIQPDCISVSFATVLPGTKLYDEHRLQYQPNSIAFNDYHIRSNIHLANVTFDDLKAARAAIFDVIRKTNTKRIDSK